MLLFSIHFVFLQLFETSLPSAIPCNEMRKKYYFFHSPISLSHSSFFWNPFTHSSFEKIGIICTNRIRSSIFSSSYFVYFSFTRGKNKKANKTNKKTENKCSMINGKGNDLFASKFIRHVISMHSAHTHKLQFHECGCCIIIITITNCNCKLWFYCYYYHLNVNGIMWNDKQERALNENEQIMIIAVVVVVATHRYLSNSCNVSLQHSNNSNNAFCTCTKIVCTAWRCVCAVAVERTKNNNTDVRFTFFLFFIWLHVKTCETENKCMLVFHLKIGADCEKFM